VTHIGVGKCYDGTNTLYFTTDKSLYIHNSYPKSDEYQNLGTVKQFIKGDPEGFPIFIDAKENKIYYKTNYQSTQDLFIFKDSIPKIKWSIQKENRIIGRFKCFRARGLFGGRIYNVWFTPDIPLPYGPYKLGGLAGLILEAYAEDGMVKYTFNSLETDASDSPMLVKPKNGKEISWVAFKEFIISSLLRVEALSNSEYTVTDNDPPSDYYIEKEQFTILSTYKKERQNKKKQ